jgi:hypothetical protein
MKGRRQRLFWRRLKFLNTTDKQNKTLSTTYTEASIVVIIIIIIINIFMYSFIIVYFVSSALNLLSWEDW